MPDQYPDIAVIILAAGASSRLGRPKQLLGYKGTTLLGYTIARAKSISPVIIVVTGAASEQVAAAIVREDIHTAYNPNWQTGMASSLRVGVEALDNYPGIKGALILLCDQPLITAAHLQALQHAFVNGQYESIAATTYQDVRGVPAIFPKTTFERLLRLSGDEGARKLLRNDRDNIISVPFDSASLDIDTPEDYRSIITK